jgi:peptidoglycan-associated lipoprotein
MNRSFCKYTLILACGALCAGGCAKREIVKKDEVIPAETAKSAETSSSKPSPTETVIKEQPIKEAPVTGLASKGISEAAQLETTLERIFFDFDSYQLSPAARDTLVKSAEIMKKNDGARLQIEGHCDERGSDEYNLALGDKRAKSAMQYLVTMGVPADRLAVISYGEEKPADPGHTESSWAKNRRDEFVRMTK